jgi:hypothetical protein
MDSRDVSNPHNIGIYERGEPQSGEPEKGKTARMIPYIRSKYWVLSKIRK